MLRIVIRLLQLIVFLVILAFAIKNSDQVALKFFQGWEWQAPLILVLLIVFVCGALLGVMGCLPALFSVRRELAQLRQRQIQPQGIERRKNTGTASERVPDTAPPADHVRG